VTFTLGACGKTSALKAIEKGRDSAANFVALCKLLLYPFADSLKFFLISVGYGDFGGLSQR
jgi:hypothetical protein